MARRLPDQAEIDSTAGVIRAREFLYLTRFADMLGRYVDIKLQDQRNHFNRLRFNTLSFLVARGGSLTPTQFARRMFRSKYSITSVIDNLEEEGFVIRVHDKHDRRSVQVKITVNGLAFLNRLLEQRAGDEKQILSCLDAGEIAMLANIIRKLDRRLAESLNGK